MLRSSCLFLLLSTSTIYSHTIKQQHHTNKLTKSDRHVLFQSIAQHTVPEQSATITGTIPAWIQGHLWKNGFGQFEGQAGFEFNYLFDVMSYISRFTITNQTVTYTTRLLEGAYFNDSLTEVPPYRTFGGTNPGIPVNEWPEALITAVSDNLNVNIVQYGSRLFAISDMAGSMEIDPITLASKGLYQFSDPLTSTFDMITSAHPTQLPNNPYIYSYKAAVFGNFPNISDINRYELWRLDTSTPEPWKREVFAEIGVARIPYVHSFALTEKHMVLVEFPLFWNIMHIATTLDPILKSMEWLPELNNGTRILVVDIATGKVTHTYHTDPFFAYHHINAFENQNGDFVFDICYYPDNTHMQAFNLKTLRDSSYHIPQTIIKRYTLPISNINDSNVQVQTIGNASFDLPGINNNVKGLPYQYAYGTGNYDQSQGDWWNTLVKVNMNTGEQLTWYKPQHWPTEPSFLQTPGSTIEDDGVLLSIVLDASATPPVSYLLFLNATDMTVLSTAYTNIHMPYTSHGFFQQV